MKYRLISIPNFWEFEFGDFYHGLSSINSIKLGNIYDIYEVNDTKPFNTKYIVKLEGLFILKITHDEFKKHFISIREFNLNLLLDEKI